MDINKYLKNKHKVSFNNIVEDIVKEAQKEEREEIKLLLESFDLNEAIEKIEIYEESIN